LKPSRHRHVKPPNAQPRKRQLAGGVEQLPFLKVEARSEQLLDFLHCASFSFFVTDLSIHPGTA